MNILEAIHINMREPALCRQKAKKSFLSFYLFFYLFFLVCMAALLACLRIRMGRHG